MVAIKHIVAAAIGVLGIVLAPVCARADGPASLAALKSQYHRPDSIPFPADNGYSDAKLKLGQALFFDPRLSGPGTISCASCHNPGLGWKDGLAHGVGFGARELPRATPTILDLAWADLEVLRNTYAAAAQHQAAALPAATSERQRLVEQARGMAPPPPPPADADAAAMRDASGAVLDDLDVAIDRATSDHARAGAVALRSRIVGAVAPGAPAARALATLEALRPVFDDTVEAFAQDGFAYRTRAEALMLRSDRETRWAIGAGVGAAGVITVLLTWMIVPQVRRAARAAEAIAAGRLDTRIPTPRRPRWSETSRLLGSLAAMQAAIRGNLERIEALHAEEARSRAATMAQRRASLLEMADRVEQETRVAVDNFQAQTAAMRETAEAMAALAARSGDNAQTAAAAAAAAHDSVRQVAASTDALAGSTSAIGETVGRCNAVVRHAVELGRNTQGSIVALSEHVERIGRVAEMIADIAARTNLLALNATIEAARAGEAGRGFAVVAGEVKALAKQTTHSTQEIGTLIAEVRAATLATVDSVQQIGRTVDEINVVSGQITEAIDIQGAATAEIAGNVTQTSQAAEQLAQLIAEVAEHSEATMRRAGQIRGETLVLSDAVATLRLEVVRTIRSSSDEVDRRTWHRFPVDLAGRLETGTGAAAVPMRVRDLSEGGARLEAAADLAPGATGTLSVDGIDMKLPFEVRQIQHRAGTPMLHVMFVLNEAQRDALRGVPERLSQLEAPVARAA